jgi:hypothetical protein
MKHPLHAVPPEKRRRVFLALLGVFALLTLALFSGGAPLRTPAAPLGVLTMEFTGDPERARAVVESWGPEQRARAGFDLGLDYLYAVVYSTGLALACVWTGDLLRARRWPLASAAVPLAWLQWAGGALDGVENLSILASLEGNYAWAPLAPLCAIPKFLLIFVGIGYGLLGLAARYAVRPAAPRAV